MCSSDEYQHQNYWKQRTWLEKTTESVKVKSQKELDEWFSETHDHVMEKLKNIKKENK